MVLAFKVDDTSAGYIRFRSMTPNPDGGATHTLHSGSGRNPPIVPTNTIKRIEEILTLTNGTYARLRILWAPFYHPTQSKNFM